MVLDRSNTGIVGSNPDRGMDVLRVLFCVGLPWDDLPLSPQSEKSREAYSCYLGV